MSKHLNLAASACNRFGLGARPGELAKINDARGWLAAQLRDDADSLPSGLPSSGAYLVREAKFARERREGKAAGDPKSTFRDSFASDLRNESLARWRIAVEGADGFHERLVRFWSNHFAVSVDKRAATLYAIPLEREAIRPHVTGRFGDLLLAVEMHPAMLRYLDNAQSMGPDSIVADRAQRRQERTGKGRRSGLNENLAREILELHTLGADGGYRQDDVSELARAITGWGLPLPRELVDGSVPAGTGFSFHPLAHEPGTRSLLGRRYAQSGMEQGRAMLADLAMHPRTAAHVSAKIARHFVSDVPDPVLVAHMTRTWLAREGDIGAVCRAMIDSDAAWNTDAMKLKSPQDFVVSALRAVGTTIDPLRLTQYAALLERLGEPELKPRSPAGFPDQANAWLEGDAIWKRLQVAVALAWHAGGDAENALRAGDALGPRLDEETSEAMRRAGSPAQALATLFASPAFQWRT
ncbi:MAG: DUF1800 domain-containing protein [Dokdonella sp.]